MQNTISILENLIRIPSFVSDSVNEKSIAQFVSDALSRLPSNWKSSEQLVAGDRNNVYVANDDNPEILFTAHLDTVPPTDAWTHNPFVPTRVGARMFGLGAVDMKAGAAVILSLLFRRAGTNKKVAALFYVGEEYDFCGMKMFVARTQIRPNLIVNPEPTDLRVYSGCRGVLECRLIVEGRAAHAAQGDGVNAIQVITRAVDELVRCLSALPDEGLGISTVNLAWIHGGLPFGGAIISRPNMIPPFAEAVVEIRIANARIDEAFVRAALSGAIAREGGKLMSAVVAFRVGPMASPLRCKTPFDEFEVGNPKTTGYFDTQLFIEARGGSPIVCGPGPSSRAHHADEYVDLRDVERLETVLAKCF